MGDVVELARHYTMTPEQVIGRVSRETFDEVIVIGRKSALKEIWYFTSDMPEDRIVWLLQKINHAVIESS